MKKTKLNMKNRYSLTRQMVVIWMMAATLTLPLRSNPQNGVVDVGSATFSTDGSTFTVHQSTASAIYSWSNHDIAAGEITQYLMPDSSSIALSRVTDGNPTQIYGTLNSNGNLYLINQSGIMVGSSGVINTASFIASTLDISNTEFLAGGNLNFSGSSTAGIQNFGTINALGGDVFLIAQTVENKGTISALNGTVGLAAGNNVLLVPSGTDRISVQPSALVTGVTGIANSETIDAARAELEAAGGNVYALAINHTGLIRATGSTTTPDGSIYLTANGGTIDNSGSMIAKDANGNGGEVRVL